MYLAFFIVLLGVTILWKRDRLAGSWVRVQQRLVGAMPWLYPGWIGRVYTSERAWRMVAFPLLGLAFIVFGVVWLWEGV